MTDEASHTSTDADPYIGKRLADRYDILWKVGEGGMARVYAARHAHLGRNVAIKLLIGEYVEDGSAAELILREAKVMGSLGHPHICEARDAGVTADGTPFLVLEMLTGRPLSREIERVGGLEPRRVVEIALQIASAMGAAHDLGIVHRDLKPENVFLLDDKDGERDRVKVLDFGIAKQPTELSGKSSLTTATRAVGTPGYMAPEMLTAPASTDRRADVYSLGAVLYEMLAARPPYAGIEVPEVFRAIIDRDPVPLRELVPAAPAPLLAAIETAMSRDPAARYPTMAAFSDALRRLGIAGVRTTGVPALSTGTDLGAQPPGSPLRGAIVIGGLVAIGAVVAALVITRRPPPQPAPIVAAPAPAPTAAVPAEVQVVMRSASPGAQATLRDRVYPLPLDQRIARNGQPEMVEVSAPKMVSRRMWLTFDRDQTLEVALEAVPPSVPAPAAATPAAAKHGAHPGKPTAAAPVAAPAVVATPAARAPEPAPSPAPPAPVAAKPAPVAAAKPAAPTKAAPLFVLPGAAVQQQLAAHRSAIEACIAEDPAATGRLVYRLVVAPTGRVEAAQLVQADHRFLAVERCLVRALSVFSFAPPGQRAEARATVELD